MNVAKIPIVSVPVSYLSSGDKTTTIHASIAYSLLVICIDTVLLDNCLQWYVYSIPGKNVYKISRDRLFYNSGRFNRLQFGLSNWKPQLHPNLRLHQIDRRITQKSSKLAPRQGRSQGVGSAPTSTLLECVRF